MAIVATVTSTQTIQFDVPGIAPAGASRVFITTGIAEFFLSVGSQTGNALSNTQSVKVLVDPVIAPGQFRKATAMVGIGQAFRQESNTSGEFSDAAWRIDDVAASLDDESGKVELRFEVSVVSGGTNCTTQLRRATFQVTSIAAI
jgi:hypothetical protein